MRKSAVLAIAAFIPACFFSQEIPRDTLSVPVRDSLYQKIEDFSERNKTSRFFYKLLFRNVSDKKGAKDLIPENPELFRGKHIRKINIETYDPLGFGIPDENQRWYDRLGNRLHVKTRPGTVRNYLLFRPGDEYSQQALYESERLLRATRFVHRVSIRAVDSTATRDSVDVNISLRDSWSLRPMGSVSGSKIGFGLEEMNFLGLGHELSVYYRRNFKEKEDFTRTYYKANNLFGTFVDSTVFWERDMDENEYAYLYAGRNFISPLMRWAGGGGLYFYNYFKRIPPDYQTAPENMPLEPIKFHAQEVWAGYQFRLFAQNSNTVRSNITLAARFRNMAYVDTPEEWLDPEAYFSSHQLYLASVGYTRRKYQVSKNIFNFNLPEDLPYGLKYSVTAGAMNVKGGKLLPYFGGDLGYGALLDWGMLNQRLQYGTFLRDGEMHRSTFRWDGTFFTPLRDYGKLNLRHFFSHTLVMGDRRSATLADRLNINNREEFPNFDEAVVGLDKLLLRYQAQIFINKPWKNFYLNPYFNATLGFLGTDKNLFKNPPNYKFAVGILLYNPYLAFNRFQLSLAYYPRRPFEEKGDFRFNGYRNYYIPLNTFEINAPGIVRYSDMPYGY
ncbi:hypothetical protein IMZ16_02825 [Cruoricaptor ignavus]|uniref:Uncharacterized protein n=1 Tax=Cruoricaptor ignavus TaxID=1118202 RepID=A0A7M1T3K2_9FLAO|nr:hypothetical protein [Cruoricaptor ignavus]QOR74389.1 hypothetical protein IMZ16_02825 [Cruoricaptor ignavus]